MNQNITVMIVVFQKKMFHFNALMIVKERVIAYQVNAIANRVIMDKIVKNKLF